MRVSSRNLSFGLYFSWLAISCLALIVMPTALRLGVPIWELDSGQLLPIYLSGIAYLMYSLILFYASRGDAGLSIYLALVIGGICFALSAGTLGFMEELEYSRLVLLGSIALGVFLAIFPLLLNRSWLILAAVALLSLVIAVVAWILLKQNQGDDQDQERLHSSLYVLEKTTYDIIPSMPQVDGGAITTSEDGYIAVTGDGQFHRLTWSGQDGKLIAAKLPLESPLVGRDDFYADKVKSGLQFRVTDLLLRPLDEGYQIFVAHQVWNRADDCFLMGVSYATLPQSADADVEAWTTLYETQPCIEQPFDTVETGGRLAWAGPDRLMLTVGDHGSDGRHAAALSQDPAADYGKVLILDMDGGAEILTSGHRNPQGLVVDKQGQAWITEHGPAGGDELNLLGAGQNYGWPLATYGTDYYKLTWPLNPDARNHGEFTEPTHAFVPSIAISNLIQLGGQQFPRWEDDFLVGSLRMETLYRLRMRDNGVIFVEPIYLGKRIRDLVEAPDGRVVIWSDDESITVLSRAIDPNSGEGTFEQCRRCHESVGKSKAIAPDLKGIFGREIASESGYPYSQSLSDIDGEWSRENLLQFLQDPQGFAPGTAMGSNAVPDAADRAALVEFLKGY